MPPNVRVMFEVQDLKFATLATVSRCGMVWFSEDVLSTEMIFENYLSRLRNIPLDDSDEDFSGSNKAALQEKEDEVSPCLSVNFLFKYSSSLFIEINKMFFFFFSILKTQRDVSLLLQPYFSADGLVVRCLEYAMNQEHIMDFTRLRALSSLFSMLNKFTRNVLVYNQQHSDFPITSDQLEQYIPKALIYSLLWSFAGDAKLKVRSDLGDFIRSITTITLPNQTGVPIIDFEVNMSGEWVPWSNKVPVIEVETHKVAAPDVVVPTLDTVRHESLLYTWLAEHKPLGMKPISLFFLVFF